MNVDSVLTALGVLIAAIGLGTGARRSIRKDKLDQATRNQEATDKAVRDAIEPIARDLSEMTDQRNDWRDQARKKDDRINQLQDQINNRQAPPQAAP